MKNDLTILTVTENNTGLFELMHSSVMAFTDFAPKFIVCNNGGFLGTQKNVSVVNGFPGELKGGSNRHGYGLQRILPMVETKYTAIIESDMVVLDRSWYKIKPGCRVKTSVKQAGLYHCCFIVFETDLLKGMDFRPGNNDKERLNTINYKPKRDVGWRLHDYMDNEANIDYVMFVDCKSGKGKHFDSRFQSDEFHTLEGKCIAAHLGRGSNIGGKAIRKGFIHPKYQMVEWKKTATRIIRDEERKSKQYIK